MKKNLVLLNLGSPDNPDPKAVGRYLREFLMDRYVLDIHKFWRWLLVNILIVPRRKYRSSEAYQKVWLKQGSPLTLNTAALSDKLQNSLGDEWNVLWAMRYGTHSLKKLKINPDERIYFLPMYPQYALSSTQTAIQQAKDLNIKGKVLKDFYQEPEFIQSYADQIRNFMTAHPDYRLLFSFHGLPLRHLKQAVQSEYCQADASCCEVISEQNRWCYRAQCFATAKQIAKMVGVEKVDISFQSRLGRGWIEPFTDQVIKAWAQSGVKKAAVVCPSFVADCLETLEEVAIGLKNSFIENGGEDLKLIPCLNYEDQWVENLKTLILRTHQEWPRLEADH